jgi:hypothetical protein
MSSGTYIDATYVTDLSKIVPIRVQPETVNATWNTNGLGTIEAGLPSAQVGRGRNTIGINARMARFSWFSGTPANYDESGIISLPILTKAKFDALVKATDYAYLGGVIRLVGKTSEKIR